MTLLETLLASPVDLAAFIVFVLVWLGYQHALGRFGRRTINGQMKIVRRQWMRVMLGRDIRIPDTALLGHVMNSTAFFASTTVLVSAAMVGALSNLSSMQPAIESLDFTVKTDRTFFEIKMALPLVVFVGGFFRFTWALRQFNYAVALIGAAPPAEQVGDDRDALAEDIAVVLSSGAESFNAGIRCYYFALAALAWFGGGYAFLAVTIGVTAIMVRRQLWTPAARAIRRQAARQACTALPMDRR